MTPSTPSPSPTSTQVPTQTPPPITTTTPIIPQQDTDLDPTTPQQQDTDPTTPQQDTEPTTPQQQETCADPTTPKATSPQGTDPVQGPDQSTPTTIEPSTTDSFFVGPPDTSGDPVNAGLAGGLAVLGLATLVMAVTLIALLVVRRKSHSNVDLHDNLEDLYANNSYNAKTEILFIAHVMDTNPACTSHRDRETSTHLPPSSHVGEDIATSTNECYSTSRLPLPSRVHQQQDTELTQNQAYVTSGNIPVKANECYDTTMDFNHLYTTVEGEHEYDYVIP